MFHELLSGRGFGAYKMHHTLSKILSRTEKVYSLRDLDPYRHIFYSLNGV